MFFTQEDYKKIQQWLIKNSVKDTEFNEANIPFNGEETITIVQGNQNKKVFLKDLIAQVFNLGISDFVNITDKYDAPNISLEEAIRLIPSRARKEGQVITFLDREDHWHIYQFKGVLNQWNVLGTWEDLFDWEKLIIDSILPDEEDLTKSLPDENGNSYLSLKDREYNPEDFSGLGRVILRKNIMDVEDPIYGKVKKNILYQDMINKSNTIYEIRYDFDLNGKEITIPEGCVLDFQGGHFRNGILNCQYCAIYGSSKLFDNTKLINVISLQAEWLGLHPNNQDNSNIFNNIFKYLDKNNGITIIFDTGTYNFYKPVEIPIEYLGLRIISKTEKASYNGTVFYYKGNKTDTFITVRAQNVYFKGIKFVGPGYTSIETSVLIDYKRTDVATYNEDGWNDTEPNIEHCTFQNAAKCIRITGRQTIIQECVFSMFSTGIEFYNILDSNGDEWTYGERGGSSRCNRIYKNQFHAINHQGKDGENNACIVNNCKQSRWFVIQDNLNDGAGSFFSGYISSSVIRGNITYIFDGYPFYIKKCSNSVIENNHFIYNNEYDEGGQLLLASAGSMYFDGVCYSSRIIGNTIYRTALSAIRLKDSSVNFTNNEIKNNKFYRIGNALPEEDRYVIDLDTYGYIDGNVITDNFWDQGAGEEYLPSKFIRIRSNAGTGNNIVRNNYSSYMTRRAFGKTDKRSTDLGSSYDGETGIQYYDIDLNIPLFWTGDEFLDSEGIFPYRRMGNTLPIPPRQAGAWIGAPFFDTINKKPLWLNGWEDNGDPKWLDSEGNRADCKKSGLFDEKPVRPTIGYSYFCTDKQTEESGISGIVIFYKGDNVWVDALGRVVN